MRHLRAFHDAQQDIFPAEHLRPVGDQGLVIDPVKLICLREAEKLGKSDVRQLEVPLGLDILLEPAFKPLVLSAQEDDHLYIKLRAQPCEVGSRYHVPVPPMLSSDP